MTDKRDYLGECNDQAIPLEDFRLAFCVRCFQKECSRSRFGMTKFDARVGTWQERLFQAPALPKTDPRWQLITAKKFLNLPTGGPPAVRDWIDPQTLDSPSPPAQIPVISSPAPAVVKVQSPPPPAPPVAVVPPAPPPPEVQEPPRQVPPRQNLFVNTPYVEPITLSNQPRNPERPKDSWASPAPLKPGDRVVAPGTKIKIGRRT